MANKNNATCAICGKGYVMCRSCDRGKPGMTWKLHCDTPEHYQVYQVIHGYTGGVYTKAEAAERIAKINFDINEVRDNIRETITEITGGAVRKPEPIKVKPVAKPVEVETKVEAPAEVPDVNVAEPKLVESEPEHEDVKPVMPKPKTAAKVVNRRRPATV